MDGECKQSIDLIKMDKLTELKQEEIKAKHALMRIRSKILNLEEKNLTPALIKKYEGKYFKFRNSYSLPKSERDKWWVYSKVLKVKSRDEITSFAFQKDIYGEITTSKKNRTSESILQIEITKREFDAAYNKMIQTINKYNG